MHFCKWREHIGTATFRAGALASASAGAGPAEPALGRAHDPQAHEVALANLTTLARVLLLAGVPAGTGAIGPVVEDVETVNCGALAAVRGTEAAAPDGAI